MSKQKTIIEEKTIFAGDLVENLTQKVIKIEDVNVILASLAEEVMACVGDDVNTKIVDNTCTICEEHWSECCCELYNGQKYKIRKTLRALFFRHNIKLK